jgi:hypothetical protein
MPKNAEYFNCNYCDFKCFKKSNWDTHLMTRKHQNRTKLNKDESKKMQIMPNINSFKCNKCNKEYNARNSLWYHEKKCKNKNEENESNTDKELIKMVLKDNNELKQLILELCKNGINNNNTILHNTNNTNNTNCNNKTFNLQLFLNETCKNAMNIMDFVNSIQLQLTDLEKVGELGYVEGISKIIINNLKLLDITERPVHCSDMKRDILYVKDDDKWEKEENENPKIKKAIKCIANKNISLIPEWKQKYPDCNNSNSRKSDIINKIIIESMETNKEKTDKIIKKIAKEVGIDKES